MVNSVNMIIYVDYLLLGILIGALLRPTKVLFSHKREIDSVEELRTVVAYQNPFTGDYCVHKSRVGPKGYLNSVQIPESPDSGVSDEYEPLNLEPGPRVNVPENEGFPQKLVERNELKRIQNGDFPVKHPAEPVYDNSVNRTWNWNYKEYQI